MNTSLEAAPRRELLLPGDQGLERHGVGGEVDRPAAAEAPLVQPARDLVRHHLAAVGVHEEGERGGAHRGGAYGVPIAIVTLSVGVVTPKYEFGLFGAAFGKDLEGRLRRSGITCQVW